mgnify:CR=1 FL=1
MSSISNRSKIVLGIGVVVVVVVVIVGVAYILSRDQSTTTTTTTTTTKSATKNIVQTISTTQVPTTISTISVPTTISTMPFPTTISTTPVPTTISTANDSESLLIQSCGLIRPYDRVREKCLYKYDDTDGMCPQNNSEDWYYMADGNCMSSKTKPREPVYYNTELHISSIHNYMLCYMPSPGTLSTCPLVQAHQDPKWLKWKIVPSDNVSTPYIKYGDDVYLFSFNYDIYVDWTGDMSKCRCSDKYCGILRNKKTVNTFKILPFNDNEHNIGDIVYADDQILLNSNDSPTLFLANCGSNKEEGDKCLGVGACHGTNSTTNKTRTNAQWKFKYPDDYYTKKQRLNVNNGEWNDI